VTELDPIRSIARLDDPVRRSLYDWVVARHDAVGRNEAAAVVGISRALAAFHLDRLVDDGLLTAEYRRLSGRSGPGAGRPAKLYRRAARTIAVSLPSRDYELAATVLADAVERSSQDVPPPAIRAAAHEAGRTIGAEARRSAGPRLGRRRRREAFVEVLRDRGYEPREDRPGEIVLGNCPFHALVDDHQQLVCGMNLALTSGVLDGLGIVGAEVVLDPAPGRCCVLIRDAATA
jgi:predicted ArsR family transcriptional regulator